MPDAPDSYQYIKPSSRGLLQDMAELAARLDSPNVLTRSGVTIVQETFVNGLGSWFTGATPATSKCRLSLDNGGFGGAAVNFNLPGLGSETAFIYRYFNVPEVQKTGVELSVEFPLHFDYLEFYLRLYDATGEYAGWIRYDNTVQQFQYRDTDLNFIKIADFDIEQGNNHRYDQLKLVVDFEAYEYCTFRYNQHVYSLAGIPLISNPLTTGNSLLIYVKGENDGVNSADFYLGYLIITTAEI